MDGLVSYEPGPGGKFVEFDGHDHRSTVRAEHLPLIVPPSNLYEGGRCNA